MYKKIFFAKSRILLLFILPLYFNAYSQIKPGLIFEPATGAGRIVLDPNLDGYISKTTAGFSGLDDQTSNASEIVFNQIPIISEPSSDLGAGPNCKYTDFVGDNTNANMSSVVGYYLDANNNWIYRMRMASYSPSTKSYSILIDTDGKFGNSGPNADPQYVAGNPGFEIEMLLSTNNGVYIYDVNNNTNNSVLKKSYSGRSNYQMSKALSQVCGSYNIFIDLFVPFGDLTTFFGITTSTPLRWVVADNMSALQSTIGHLSNISDIAGVNGANNETGLASFINNQTPTCASCSPSGLRSACPTITAPIQNLATSVSGTSTEANGTVITLYKNGVATSFTTTVSAGAWTITGISPPLSGGTPDIIGATAKASGKGESIYNCNVVTVKACGSVAPLGSATLISGRWVCGPAGTGISGATITVRSNGFVVTAGTNKGVNSDGSFIWSCLTNSTATNCATASSTSTPCLSSSTSYEVYQTVGGCISDAVCRDPNLSGGTIGTTTAAPVITTTPITTATVSISGTCVSGATIILYADGVQIGTVTATGTTTWTISSLSLSFGQVITAKARSTNQCTSIASASKTVSKGTSSAPIINAPPCGTTGITVSGISGEAAGTAITLKDNTNGNTVGSTTVAANGTWSITGLTLTAGQQLAAYATIAGGSISAKSNVVTVTAKTTNAVVISGSYTNQSTAVTGTGTTGDVIRLYIDGALFATTATVSGGTWSISVTAGQTVFKDAVLKATATTGSNCESSFSNSVTVTAVAPTIVSVSQTVSTCTGIASIVVPSTQFGVLYQLYDGANPFSIGVPGNGSSITLLSYFVNATKTGLTVNATRITDETSRATMSGTVTIAIDAADSTWRGTFSNDWFDYRNWCLNGAIPTSTIKAKILSGTPFSPVISTAGAVCDTLILYSGASLTTSGSQNLDVYGSWINNGGTFTPNSGTVSFKGTDTLSIGGTSSTTFSNVTVNLTGTTGNDQITLNQPTTITGLLTLTDGRIKTTTTNILALTSTASATIGNDTSFVNGPMSKTGTTAFVFPVGSGTNYGPIGLDTPSASSTFQAQYFASAYNNTTSFATTPTPALRSVSTVEYWNLIQTSGTASAKVQLFWQNSTTSGVANAGCANLQEARWNGAAWVNVDSTNNEVITDCPDSLTSKGSITSSILVSSSSFGTFTFGSTTAVPLPVELMSFRGECLDDDIVLKWITTSELNNNYFTLERAIATSVFVPIAEVEGAGNSNEVLNYEYTDNGVLKNTSAADLFYRIKQTDFDGKYEYFDVIDVVNKCKDNLADVVLFPTISKGNIVVLSDAKIVDRIEVYNTLGEKVYENEIIGLKVDLFLNLRSGLYHYVLKDNKEVVGKGKLIIE
jgi:hypothetical protein